MPQIHVDREVCIGAGLCVVTAPHVFDQDDEGLVALVNGPPEPDDPAVQQAVSRCPSGALSATD